MLVDFLIVGLIAGVVGFCGGLFIGGSGKDSLMRERADLMFQNIQLMNDNRDLKQTLNETLNSKAA